VDAEDMEAMALLQIAKEALKGYRWLKYGLKE
jgi:hypothetical protein